MIRCFPVLLFLVAVSAHAALPLYQKAPPVEISGSCGGKLDGSAWSSAGISEKVFAVYYIDPDEADLNEPFFNTLKAQNFPEDKVQSVAIINMKATWLPGGILSIALKSKQKKYPGTLYVKDNCRTLISAWQLADHSSNVLIFNQQGQVIFSVDGKLTDDQIGQAVDLIWNAIGGKNADPSD